MIGLAEGILLGVFGLIAAISLGYSIPISMRERRRRNIESALPDFLVALSKEIDNGMSFEFALKEAAAVRNDLLGRYLRDVVKDMGKRSVTETLHILSTRVESRLASRTFSLIEVGLEAEAPVSELLDKIGNELWDTYMLRIDRENQTAKHAAFILWGGTVLLAGMSALILSFFDPSNINIGLVDTAELGKELDNLIIMIKIFLVITGACASMMWGVINDRVKVGIMRIPFFMFLSYVMFIIGYQAGSSLIRSFA